MEPKPRRRLDPTAGDPWGDPTSAQPGPVGSAVVTLVGVDLARSLAPPSRRRADRRNVIQDGCEHGGVAGVGGGRRRRQRQPTAVADQVELGSRLAAIDTAGRAADVLERYAVRAGQLSKLDARLLRRLLTSY
jgi:hypothetical protein